MKKIKIDRAIQERPATRKQTRNEKIRQSLTEHVDVQVIPAITDREGYEKPKLRVCAYCRVSTDMDTQALSYELQVQNYTDYIRGNDEWQFAGIYADRGISGTSLKHRDEFNRMIEDCKAGKIDLIITKAVTRFARNVLDCISTIRMLKQLEHPVAVYFETERINTLDTTSETYLGLISLFAQGESESKSESLKWSYIRRWKRGTGIYPAWSLLGYEMGEDGKWQIVEAEAELVRIIYDMYLNGYSSPQIAEILTRSGVPTATNQTVWSSGGVLGILRNGSYLSGWRNADERSSIDSENTQIPCHGTGVLLLEGARWAIWYRWHSRYHRLSQGTLHCAGSQGRQKHPDKTAGGYH